MESRRKGPKAPLSLCYFISLHQNRFRFFKTSHVRKNYRKQLISKPISNQKREKKEINNQYKIRWFLDIAHRTITIWIWSKIFVLIITSRTSLLIISCWTCVLIITSWISVLIITIWTSVLCTDHNHLNICTLYWS